MQEALTEYDEALKEKAGEIRNHQAYFFGVVKRYKTLHERSLTGDANAIPQGDKLTDQVLVSLISVSGVLSLPLF